MPPEGTDDDNDDDDDVDKCCAWKEHSEDVGEDGFAVEYLSPKQQGGDYWLQDKKRPKEVIWKLEKQLEQESERENGQSRYLGWGEMSIRTRKEGNGRRLARR